MKVTRVILVTPFLHRGSHRKEFVDGKDNVSLALVDRGVEVVSTGGNDLRRYWVPLTDVAALEVAEEAAKRGRPAKADDAA